SDYTSLNAEQRARVQRGIDQSYHEFVAKVAAARHRPYAEIEPVAEGRVWLGSQARPRGLVDELGGLDTAIALLKKKAGIPATEDVGLLLYPGRRTLLDIWLKRSQDDALETRLRAVFGRVPFRAWMKGGMLRMMPQWIEVR
ncbi:MAG: S49 family peptidase, partial [Bryobacteraceae bacterium]